MLATVIEFKVMDWRQRTRNLMTDRKGVKVTQERLASCLGVSPGALGHWLTGRREPSLSDIEKIAKEFNVTPAYLLYGIEEQSTEQQSEIDTAKLKKCISAVFSDMVDKDLLYSVDALSEYILELYADPSDLDKPSKIKRFIELILSKIKK